MEMREVRAFVTELYAIQLYITTEYGTAYWVNGREDGRFTGLSLTGVLNGLAN